MAPQIKKRTKARQPDKLCQYCRRISVHSLKSRIAHPPSLWSDEAHYVAEFSGTEGMKHLENARDLRDSAEICELCSLMAEKVWLYFRSWEPIKETPIYLSPLLVYVNQPYSRRLKVNFPYSSEYRHTLLGMEVWIPTHSTDRLSGYYHFGMRFYSEDDSPHTFQHVTSRTPLVSTGSPQAFHRLQKCISACQDTHEDCWTTISGTALARNEKPILPTRVIDLGPPESNQEPHLLCTHNTRGGYVALSHCWGTYQPIKTTKDTLDEFLRTIPWDRIPRTFRDAMKITREIGLRYLWIDSLCIVQGDTEDFARESVMMGSIYENAYLVVAAADARDSRGGCFFQTKKRREPRLIKLPYLDSSGTTNGLLHVGLDDEVPLASENESPLSTRAWITQEWLLARRMVFYTRNGLVWSCKELRLEPTLANHAPALVPELNWSFVIKTHTSRKLTYFTDRLVSLEGIRTKIQAKSGARYEHGVFEDHLQSQLIWQVQYRCPANRKQNPLQVPSWSWASNMSGVDFLSGDDNPLVSGKSEGEEVDCGDIRFDNDGAAIIVPAGRIRVLKRLIWDNPDRDNYADSIYSNTSDTEDDHSDAAKSAEEDRGCDRPDSPIDGDTDNLEIEEDCVSEDDTELDPETACIIQFDECKPPDLKRGQLIALLLVERHMSFSGNEEIFEEYFVILQPCTGVDGVPNDTYVRIGAGYYDNNWRYTRERAFRRAEVKSLRIV